MLKSSMKSPSSRSVAPIETGEGDASNASNTSSESSVGWAQYGVLGGVGVDPSAPRLVSTVVWSELKSICDRLKRVGRMIESTGTVDEREEAKLFISAQMEDALHDAELVETFKRARPRRVSENVVIRERITDDAAEMRERAVGSYLKYEQQFLDRCKVAGLSEEDLRNWRRKTGTRRKPLQGHHVSLRPLVEFVSIYDAKTIADTILEVKWIDLVIYWISHSFLYSAPLLGLLLPFSFIGATGTCDMIFSEPDVSENYTTCFDNKGVHFCLQCVLFHWSFSLIVGLGTACLNVSPGMAWFVWRQERSRIAITVGSTILYSIISLSLHFNFLLLFFMLARLVFVIYVCFFEADRVRQKLRSHPTKYLKYIGGAGSRGSQLIIMIVVCCLLAATDVFRHYLVMLVAEEKSLIKFDVVNPLNGNILQITNKQMADASFFTGFVFLVETLLSIVKTRHGELSVTTRIMYA